MVDVFELFIPVLYRCQVSIVAVHTYCTGYFSCGTQKVLCIVLPSLRTETHFRSSIASLFPGPGENSHIKVTGMLVSLMQILVTLRVFGTESHYICQFRYRLVRAVHKEIYKTEML